uniref:putative ATP-dependent RNA helicase TDRD12 n=1 Tax=Myxine glutinosa TaxID=7769 RepID=UPI00358F603C
MDQDVHVCLEEQRSEELRQFITSQDQQKKIKGLIFANDSLQARQLHEELCSLDLPCLLALEPEEQQAAQLQWDSEHDTSMINIVTDDSCLRLDVSNATTVIHYTFPDSLKVLCQRLTCLRDNFGSVIPEYERIGKAKPSSLLLVTKKCMAEAGDLLYHLVLAGIALPNSLQQLISAGAAAKLKVQEHQPLCNNIKTFGICRSERDCHYRHSLLPDKDSLVIAKSALGSTVTVFVSCILDAARFLGRVESNSQVDRSDHELDKEQAASKYLHITGNMAVYFARNAPVTPIRIILGHLYAFRQNGDVYSRCSLGRHSFCDVDPKLIGGILSTSLVFCENTLIRTMSTMSL